MELKKLRDSRFWYSIGHYSILSAFIVCKKGKVYDKDKIALDELKEKSEKLSLENIEIGKTDGNLQTDFPDNYFNAVLLYDILLKDKNQFEGLDYYEPDMNYRFILELKELEEKKSIKVNDTGGNVKDMLI
ncbi:MAG: hypothetical protein DRH57_06295 [Candidatus Cloacimonadota bacterium]|nr:MAG: hypothetical protein DRH57_06295 [Candidatus Cloacimonadota bacterium]